MRASKPIKHQILLLPIFLFFAFVSAASAQLSSECKYLKPEAPTNLRNDDHDPLLFLPPIGVTEDTYNYFSNLLNEELASVSKYEGQLPAFYDCLRRTGMARKNPSTLALYNERERESRTLAARLRSKISSSRTQLNSMWSATNQTVASIDGKCPSNLAGLASKLPQYDHVELRKLRQAILSTDISQALATARSQGFTTVTAAKAALDQAKISDSNLLVAEQCITGAATNPTLVLMELRNGSYVFGSGGITPNCALGYVAAQYQATANRGAATALACWARAER